LIERVVDGKLIVLAVELNARSALFQLICRVLYQLHLTAQLFAIMSSMTFLPFQMMITFTVAWKSTMTSDKVTLVGNSGIASGDDLQ
jgi:hypothetical protein